MKLLFRLFLVILIASSGLALKAQTQFPDDGELYRHDVVPRIDILINPDTLNWIYQHVDSEIEFKAVFVFDNGTVHDTVSNVGFKLRGNTSLISQKKSFRVSFNSFVSGGEYNGVEKLNLNGEHNDPSISRSLLYWKILRNADLPGPRANHVRVYINGNYYGLYMNVENIDEKFASKFFGNSNGNLYKCLYGSNLTYKGSNPDNYKYTVNDQRVYDLKTNETKDDYSDIADFIIALNNTPLADLPCKLEKVFNVHDYLKVAAVDILTGNWDGYIFNNNNFYLYHNSKTGLIEYIPYDTDNTFGIDWFNINWAMRNIYSWENPNDPRPLFTRLLEVPQYKAEFTLYLKNIIQSVTSQTSFTTFINSIRQQIRPFVVNDPYYPLDYGFNISTFDNSWESTVGGHVPIGIMPFISTRNASALSQCIQSNIQPVINFISHNDPIKWEAMIISARIFDDNLLDVQLEYKINSGNQNLIAMNDSGIEGDMLAGDGIYSVSLIGMAENTIVEFRIKATDKDQQVTFRPCDPVKYTVPVQVPKVLFINEFMAANKSTIKDEFGESDDWIELYNADHNSVWLGDKYLSDNLDNPTKWALPDTTILPGGFLIIWADDQSTQGSMHASFKLSKDTEAIGLFGNNQSGNALIDAVEYTSQSTDISQGRKFDGDEEWVFFSVPTPGSSNGKSEPVEEPLVELKVWPNPVSFHYIYLSEVTDFTIHDLMGRKLLSFTNTSVADISALNSGMFLLFTKDGRAVKFIKD